MNDYRCSQIDGICRFQSYKPLYEHFNLFTWSSDDLAKSLCCIKMLSEREVNSHGSQHYSFVRICELAFERIAMDIIIFFMVCFWLRTLLWSTKITENSTIKISTVKAWNCKVKRMLRIMGRLDILLFLHANTQYMYVPFDEVETSRQSNVHNVPKRITKNNR